MGLENAYGIPNMLVEGYACLTNMPTNTAFRGFGSPQGMLVIETIVDEVASKLNMSATQVNYV